jgi:hypothetical protein
MSLFFFYSMRELGFEHVRSFRLRGLLNLEVSDPLAKLGRVHPSQHLPDRYAKLQRKAEVKLAIRPGS